MSDSAPSSSRPVVLVAALAILGMLFWFWPRAPSEDERAALADDAGERSAHARGGGDGSDLRGKGTIAAERRDLLSARKAAIAGTVRDRRGQPIAGAQVCATASSRKLLRDEQQTPRCATTNADGRYRVDDLFPVEVRVQASAPRYIPQPFKRGEGARQRESVELMAGATRDGVDIVLKDGGVEIHGVVRDLSGGELEGAEVHAGGAYTLSAADGHFSLWVEPGTAYVRARADGYAGGNDRGAAPGHEFELLLTPESVLVGKVVLAGTQTPVADVNVETHLWGARSSWGRGAAARTGPDGTFRVDGLDPGAYKPAATSDEYYGIAPVEVHLGLGQTSDPVVIELHPAFTVRGAIVPDDGQICDVGSISLTDPKSKRSFYASTESDGSVTVRGVLPGTYNVDLQCDGYTPEERYEPLTVEAAVSGLEWPVHVGQSIRGVLVSASGDPVPDMHVMASRKTGAADPRARQQTDWGRETEDDGVFEFHGLKPGTYDLRITGERPGPEKPVEVELPEGRDVDDLRVELPGVGGVKGRVIDERGEPVGDVRVDLHSKDRGSRFMFWGNNSSTRARDDGTFELEHVQPGCYRATASQDWSSTLRAPGTSDDDVQGVELDVADGDTTEIELRVEAKGASIHGRVVDADGGPVSDAFISATRESDSATQVEGSSKRRSRWGDWDRRPVLTDQDGSFELDNLTVGTYTVHANRKGGGEGFVEGVQTGSDAEIRIAHTGVLGGVIKGAPEEFTVTLRDREAGVWRRDTFFRTRGVFTFEELPGGSYELSAAAGEGNAETQVTLAEGEEKRDVELALAARITVTGQLVDLDTGEPVAGLTVRVSPRGGGMIIGGPGGSEDRKEVSDAQGHFEVENAPSGEVRVSVVPANWLGSSDYGWASIMKTLPATPAVQELPPIKLVRRRVKDEERSGDLGYKLREVKPDEEWSKRELAVAFVRPGGPAETAGLKAGDVITSVDGHDVTDEETYKYSGLVTVKEGETVKLGLASGAEVSIVAGAPL